MEVQLTDFENAAYTVFVVLLTRVLVVFDLNLLLPLSLIDDNMRRAHARCPVRTQKWWFRKDVTPDMSRDRERSSSFSRNRCSESDYLPPMPSSMKGGSSEANESSTDTTEEELFEEMTLQEIMNGKGDYFPGLVPLIYAYLEHIHCEASAFQRIDAYLVFLSHRAAGELQTGADWIRNFVTSHPDYKHDSIVSPSIAHDLMKVSSTAICIFEYLYKETQWVSFFAAFRVNLQYHNSSQGMRRYWAWKVEAEVTLWICGIVNGGAYT